MEKQSNYRAYEPSKHFTDGTSARPVPAHTVARDQALTPTPLLTGRNRGELVTEFPLPVTPALLARGRERFTIYCAVCHGDDGFGRGIIVRRGFPPPPSYHEERLRREPIGHFFEVITQGYGVMYAYADRVSPADRWAIIAYIRALQRSQHATLADVPAAHRTALTAIAP
jgi:mono/diheme cytochrome c family protein